MPRIPILYSRYWQTLLLFVIFWFVASAFIAPNAGGTDVYIFKDAGCNLALKRGFTAIALPGMHGLEPHLYAAYSPGLPLLYGVFASIFGCNGYSNTYFDLIIAAVTTLVFAAIVQRAIPPRAQTLTAVLLGLVLPSGMVLTASDRPEALGLLGIMLACLVVSNSHGSLRPYIAAFIAGVTTLVHPLAGILTVPIIWTLAACQTDQFLPSREVHLAVRMVAIYLLPIALIVSFYWTVDATSLSRFEAHAFGQSSGAGALLHNGFLQLLAHAAFSSGYSSLAATSSSAIIAAMGLYYAANQSWNRQPRSFLLLSLMLFLVVFPVAVFPAQNNYMALIRAIVPIVVVLSAVAGYFPEARQRFVVIVMIVLICATNLPLLFLSILSREQTTGLYRVARNEATEFARQINDANAKPLTLVPAGVYFLYKPELGDIINPDYLDPIEKTRINGEVACSYGRRPGADNLSGLIPLTELKQLSKASSHYAPHLLAVRLMKSEWGWSCDTYITRFWPDRSNSNVGNRVLF
jgi:hypothetical protein